MRTRALTMRQYTSKDARDRAAFIEQCRRGIPIGSYIAMLNHAALTGEMPTVDTTTGAITNQTEKISVDQRLDITRFLINKAMPDLIRAEPAQDDGLKDASMDSVSADDLSKLPTDSIRALIEAQRILALAPSPSSVP